LGIGLVGGCMWVGWQGLHYAAPGVAQWLLTHDSDGGVVALLGVVVCLPVLVGAILVIDRVAWEVNEFVRRLRSRS
jgi:hypothetical protein